MWHWIGDHGTALTDIGFAWAVPILVAYMASKFFRGEYRGGEAEIALAAVRRDEDGADKKKKPRSAA